MPTAKYLIQNAGRVTEQVAATAGGSSNANTIPQLDANGRLTADMLPAGIGADADSFIASEPLAAGAFVNIYQVAGVPTVRNAIATQVGFEAHGYVVAAVSAATTATVYFDDNNTGVTGLTAGLDYYLSDATAGGVTTTSPTGAGKISQYLGKAVSATTMHVNMQRGIVLAG